MASSDPPNLSDPSLAFLSGGKEMGERTRTFDWSATPLGPASDWPQSLKTAIRIMLNSHYPMFIWWGDALIHFYNDGYIPILGKRHPDALGRSAPQVWAEIWDVVGSQADTVMQQGEASWCEEMLLLMERNGFLEEAYFTYSDSPIPDDEGGIGGVFCACSEDTRRVLGERRLRTLRTLAERTAEARTVDQAGEMAADALTANPHDLPFTLIYLLAPGDDHAELVGLTGLERHHPAAPTHLPLTTDSATPWPLGQVLASGSPLEITDLAERFPGLPGGVWPDPPQRAMVLPLSKSGHNRLAGFAVVGLSPRLVVDDDYRGFLDLLANQIATAMANARIHAEERRRAEMLAELDRAKTAFFSDVSHEFRTPLTLMLGPLEAILVRDNEVSDARQQLTMVYRNGLRLLRLVNTLLDFSRVEAGRARAIFEPVDLAALTADLASNFRSACERAGLALVVDCPPLPEPVYVDREMWEKIVLNLVSNAFKFTLTGEIRVTLDQTDGGVVLQVSDTGTGIPAAELPRLFERFHRIANPQGRTHEGSGIGLALVQELVRLHGGEVSAESEPGQGTCFTVRLSIGTAHLPPEQVDRFHSLGITATGAGPFVEEALRWLPEEAQADLEPDSAVPMDLPVTAVAITDSIERPRVLVADDNADMRQYIARLLGNRYTVEIVTDGEAALAALRDRPPSLLLSDVMMPRLDGFGLLRALRDDPTTRDLPVLLLSARAGEESRIESLEAGADDYLVKPFSARELLARVEAQLQLARLRRESATALRESEARFRTMANAAPAILWITRPDGSCSFLTQGWYDYTGQSETHALGFGWLDAVHPEDRALSQTRFLDANTKQEPFALDYRIRRHDGVYRWAIDAGRPHITADGNYQGMIGSVIDVHERKEAEEALREADRRKNTFLATLAHELRNPLAPIRSGLELLRLTGNRPDVVAQTQAMMERQLVHMVRLIDDLLDVSRISRGRLTLHRRAVTLTSTVASAVETVRPLLEEAHHDLRVSLPEAPLMMNADATRLSQVFANLLHNAVKFTPTRGRIDLQAHQDGDTAVVTVRDSGVGIPPEQLGEIFELFTQVDQSLEKSHGGLGIGLSLAKQLAELHGGEISAHSDGPGQGSEFRVHLPLVTAADTTIDTSADSSTSNRRRLLVVDDNRDAANSLSLLLQAMGHEVRTAYDGLEALDVAADYHPDGILLDIGMPRLNGYDTARRLRADPQGRSLLLVALTGWGQEDDRRQSREAGFDVHLVKPVQPSTLMDVLTKH